MIRTTIVVLLTLTLCSSLLAHTAAADEWKPQTQISLPAEANVLAYSTDGSLIAVGHVDGNVSIWNVKSGQLVRLLNAHTKKVKSVQFTLGDTRLLTIGDDNTGFLWSTSDWNAAAKIEGVAFAGGASPDGRWLAAQDPEQAIWIWDLTTLNRVKQLTEPGKGGSKNISFTADGRYVTSAYSKPLIINVETKESLALVLAGDKKTAIKIEPQGGNRATISLGQLQDDDAITHHVVPSRSGSLIALGRGWHGQPSFVDVWDVSAMKRLGRYKPADAGTLASFSYDNSLLAIEGSEKVTIWRIDKGKQVASIKAGGIMQFSPKTMELAATDGNSLIIFVPKQ